MYDVFNSDHKTYVALISLLMFIHTCLNDSPANCTRWGNN